MGIKKYTPREQFVNSLTHLPGVVLSVVGTFVLVANSKNAVQAIATAIFGVSLFLLFLSSVFYHSATDDDRVKFFQKIDHSAIYILIAGTYTPGLLFTVKFPFDVVMLSMIWILAILGIIFTCVSLKSKILSTGLYLLMGWVSLIFFKDIWATSHLTLWLFLAGGAFYSLGCGFYLSKSRYMHSVWHLFVLAGAATHFFAILELLRVINLGN